MESDPCLTAIPWETRNLGVPSFEVATEFMNRPDEEVLRTALKEKESEHGRVFVQARVSKSLSAVIPLLERHGFCFVESVLIPHTALHKNAALDKFSLDRAAFLPSRYSLAELEVAVLDRQDSVEKQRLRDIASGSFADDRFHCDGRCDKSIADRRFSFWVDDLFNDEAALFYLLRHKGHLEGFMARKEDNLILAGFSRQYVSKGMGDFLWLSVLDDMRRQGLTQARTLISVNNVAVLNLYVRLDFRFRDPGATFHYWSD